MNYKNPLPVQHALRKLGNDIQNARKRRRLPMRLICERANISRVTLANIEKGEFGVSIGKVALVLFSLGLIDRLRNLVDISHDLVGLDLEEEKLPKRIRLKKTTTKGA